MIRIPRGKSYTWPWPMPTDTPNDPIHRAPTSVDPSLEGPGTMDDWQDSPAPSGDVAGLAKELEAKAWQSTGRDGRVIEHVCWRAAAEITHLQSTLADREARIAGLEGENARLATLAAYAQHKGGCKMAVRMGRPCVCGFVKALPDAGDGR